MIATDYLMKIIVFSYKKKWFKVFRITSFFRNIILKFKDPIIKFHINNKVLLMNLSHQLPIYTVQNQLYDTAISRIINAVKSDKILHIIDVGANVGDTAASILNTNPNVKILCIEGNSFFSNLLKLNFINDNRVIIEESFCSDVTDDDKISIDTKRGTASLNSNSSKIIEVSFYKLDDLFKKQKHLNTVDLIKVDTDGFDYKVLRGCHNLIHQFKPLVFFELDKSFLSNNKEDVMSIFDFFKFYEYQAFLIYDNYGYLLGIYTFEQINVVENIINYVDSKNMYIDILMVSDFNLGMDLFKSESDSINSLLYNK